MAFSSRKTSLKFSNKRNQWENSTQSCTIEVNENENDFYKGYSYAQVIFYYDEDHKAWIFNNYSFSNTTSSHQSALRSFLGDKKNPNDKIIMVSAYTINDGLKYEKLEVSAYNTDLVSSYFPEKLKEFKEKIQSNEDLRREIKSINTMKKNIKNLNYTTISGLLKAMEKCEMNLKDVRICNVSDSLSALSLGFTASEIKNNFKFEADISQLGLYNYVTILKNEDLQKIYNVKNHAVEDRIDFKVNTFPIESESFFKDLDKFGLLEKMIKATYGDNDLEQYTSGRELKEYLVKKKLEGIAS